jgi:hypothetical protein
MLTPFNPPLSLAVTDRSSGGTFGTTCSNTYAHTTDKGIGSLPGALKGFDRMQFEIAQSLGLVVNIRPRLNYSDFNQELNSDYCNKHWIGENLSVPVATDYGKSEEDRMTDVLADFPTEKGRIKWSYNNLNQGGHYDMQFAHVRVSNINQIQR